MPVAALGSVRAKTLRIRQGLPPVVGWSPDSHDARRSSGVLARSAPRRNIVIAAVQAKSK